MGMNPLRERRRESQERGSGVGDRGVGHDQQAMAWLTSRVVLARRPTAGHPKEEEGVVMLYGGGDVIEGVVEGGDGFGGDGDGS